MTLVEINGSALDRLFQHMIVCRLRSLSITLRRQTAIESDRIIRLISSTISQSGLKNLNLNTNNLQMVIDDVSRPIQNILRHLIIRTCTYQEYQRILYCCPHLRHFVLEKCLISSLEIVTTPFTSTSYSKLISLTLYTWSLSIDELHFFLSLTPSLICLKIISRKSSCLSLFDGNSWEQFIQSKLLHLRTLEFFFSHQVSETTPVLSLDSILPSFKTPFWLNKKRWLVISEYHITSSEITLFTVPRYTNDVERVIRCDSLSVDNCCRVLVRHWTTHPEYVYTEDVCKYWRKTNISMSFFILDIDYTWSVGNNDSGCRSTISCKCITKQFSKFLCRLFRHKFSLSKIDLEQIDTSSKSNDDGSN